MLTIRQEQMQLLAAVPLREFEDRLVDEMRVFAARLFELRGEACIRTVVRNGMRRAGARGFTLRGPVRFWVQLMFAFGHDFDTDPQLQHWLAAPLADTGAPELPRAKAMFLAMQDYQAEVEGPDKAYALAALQRVLAADWQQIGQPGDGFETSLLAAMQTLYPQKAARVGDAALRELVQAAGSASSALAIEDSAGRALIAGLMFGFGHGVLYDPLYPWVAGTLDAAGSDGSARWPRLASKTRTYVQAMLGHLGS